MDPSRSLSKGQDQVIPAPVYHVAAAPRMRDLPLACRPREEADRVGIANISDAALLAILIGAGAPGCNVSELARRLLAVYGNLTELAKCTALELVNHKESAERKSFPGLGPVRAQKLLVALEAGHRMTREAVGSETTVRQPGDVYRMLQSEAHALEAEVFWVVTLNKRNAIESKPHRVTSGLLDASLVHPREVFRRAIRESSASVVLAHNHPSGDPTPSSEDVRITRQLVDAGRVIDIKVLDHVILGRPSPERDRSFVSLREEGLVDFG